MILLKQILFRNEAKYSKVHHEYDLNHILNFIASHAWHHSSSDKSTALNGLSTNGCSITLEVAAASLHCSGIALEVAGASLKCSGIALEVAGASVESCAWTELESFVPAKVHHHGSSSVSLTSLYASSAKYSSILTEGSRN